MNNVKLWLSFDGTDFHGFQRQDNGYTVQQALEEAICKITEEKSCIFGCSRTDAGVHARTYCANFKTNSSIPIEKLPLALNTKLPESIRINKAELDFDDFHASFSAIGKTYEYIICNRSILDPFISRYSWHYPKQLDYLKMNKASEYFIGEKDFSAFMATGGQAKTTVRNVYELILTENDGILNIKISANGFLYNMVRIIVGTLIYCGNGKIDPLDIPEIILSKDRKRAGITAPAKGLSLVNVYY
ncbi:MAG: tRNA pseudouridine(38-40) synthase TruA [Bacillota bacterium]|nr:tRNA pseudouridine(38-40) synthase TruA [Bacillota bacterium]